MITLEQNIANISDNYKVDKLLELGFADGAYTKIYAGYATNVDAVDVSKDANTALQAKLNKEKIKNVKLYTMDAAHLEFPDDTFNVVVSSSFHKMPDDLKYNVLVEADRVMKDPKKFVFTEPSDTGTTNELAKLLKGDNSRADQIAKTKDIIEDFAIKNGYRVNRKVDSVYVMKFDNKEALADTVISWWGKAPKNAKEKATLCEQIYGIVAAAGTLDACELHETIWTWILTR